MFKEMVMRWLKLTSIALLLLVVTGCTTDSLEKMVPADATGVVRIDVSRILKEAGMVDGGKIVLPESLQEVVDNNDTSPLCILLSDLPQMGLNLDGKAYAFFTVKTFGRVVLAELDDPDKARQMEELIAQVKAEGDTIGGVIACVVKGCSPGIGEPEFGKLHAQLGQAMLSINAVKGFEIGEGFDGVKQRGSEQNDIFIKSSELPDVPYAALNAQPSIATATNHSGGIQGGISNGQDIFFCVAFKPVATLLREQQTVDLEGNLTTFTARGRHDPCVLPRAVPVVEAMAAMTILDHWLYARTVSL